MLLPQSSPLSTKVKKSALSLLKRPSIPTVLSPLLTPLAWLLPLVTVQTSPLNSVVVSLVLLQPQDQLFWTASSSPARSASWWATSSLSQKTVMSVTSLLRLFGDLSTSALGRQPRGPQGPFSWKSGAWCSRSESLRSTLPSILTGG